MGICFACFLLTKITIFVIKSALHAMDKCRWQNCNKCPFNKKRFIYTVHTLILVSMITTGPIPSPLVYKSTKPVNNKPLKQLNLSLISEHL